MALLTQTADQDVASKAEWGAHERLYLRFSIADTGRGMTPEETKHLFMRFRQANARTHVDVGCVACQSIHDRLTRNLSWRSMEVQVSGLYHYPFPLSMFANYTSQA